MRVILPSKTTLKKLGPIVHKKRIKLNMTQNELAEGLCTQATISSLENNGNFNNWAILPDIVNRLGLDLSNMQEATYLYGEQPLERVESKLMQLKFSDAKILLDKIRPENIDNPHVKARYLCDSGFAELFSNQSLDKVLLKFHQVATMSEHDEDLLYISWSSLGLAVAYHKASLTEMANHYLHLSIDYLNKLLDGPNFHIQMRHIKVRLAVTVISFALIQGELELVENECDLLIIFLKSNYSYFCLKSFYKLKQKGFEQQQRTKEAAELRKQVRAMEFLPDTGRLNEIMEIIQ